MKFITIFKFIRELEYLIKEAKSGSMNIPVEKLEEALRKFQEEE